MSMASERDTDTFFKRFTAEGFYKLLNWMGAEVVYNHADYRLVSSRVLKEFANFKEVNLFLRGMFPLVGFKSTSVYYERHERIAGESHYPLTKMLSLAFDGITSLSIKPIRIITALGTVIAGLSFLGVIWSIVMRFMGNVVAGWSSMTCIICLIGGVQLVCLGILGEYIGKIYMEVKHRPRYIISERTEVKDTSRGPKILVSRTHPELVKRLFESEVSEVKDGTVEIMGISREAGSRSKISVRSNDPNVDPVGACGGINGTRVNAIVEELRGEKIDIVNWSEDPAVLIENALSPAKVVSVKADPQEKTARVVVPDYQLSLAIGKEGQNARLAARLTGYKIDIKNETQAIESGELPENYMELSEGVYEEEYDDDAEEFDVENTADAEYDEDDTEITFDEVEDTEE